ncbi:Cytochrome P450 [Dillenia turbinata]|uniref:Cytochrome P450 n=1 Tax=Dillenia turbinata TaxID=194707 RepID=A0AAN8VCX1_9MAGN
MDVTLLSFCATILLLSFPLVKFVLGRLTSDEAAANLPPGSFGWPFFGESLEFLFGKPENFVGTRMKKYSKDVFKTKILGEKTAVICGPNGHKFLFSNEQNYFTAFRPHPMQRLFRSYRPCKAPPTQIPREVETKLLKSPGFLKPEALIRNLEKMSLTTQAHLEYYWGGRKTKITNEVKAFPFAKTLTLTLACRFFMGMDEPERIAKLGKQFDDVTVGMHCLIVNFPGTTFYRAGKAAATIRKELSKVIKEKKEDLNSGKKQTQDILAHMIVATDPIGSYMPEAEITDKIMGLLVAGYGTVSTAMTFLMKYLGENPEVYETVLDEHREISGEKSEGELLSWEDINKMKYSWNVVCEVMRLTPPLQGTFREVITEFTYAGYTIPKGWKVYWTMGTTNKNPEYFENPEKFDPSRYQEMGETGLAPYTFIPFGGGPRMCPGKEYARLAILTFLHNVIIRFRWELVCPNEKIVGDMMPAPQYDLPIRLIPHCGIVSTRGVGKVSPNRQH